ncbi:MAG: FAD-dependent oxidoreductase [Candidatus Magasanikbacteria bacterium]|nr:FAD-dependent oxidoreductase [Candidatus Magasanikbacteria bacterium]
MFDLVIIGAAAAGCSAAIYGARRNLKQIIVTKDIGGEVALSGIVNNWPGQIETAGFKLAQDFHNHIKSYNVPVDIGYETISIKTEKKHHIVTARNADGKEKTYKTKAVLIASGIHPRSLNVPGEKELRGKGVTYCTVCDGPLFKGKTTATIGAGNAALESALMMADIAKKIYLITRYPNLAEHKGGFPKGEDILIEKVKALPNIEIIYQADTKEIIGKENVTGLKYLDIAKNKIKEIAVDGVMAHIGMVPNSDFVTCGKKNKFGEIEVNIKCQTDCPGVFAAGDVTDVPFKQIAIAAGHGVTAALSAIEYINKWKE